MSARELIALGTGSQVPTRHRNHNGYFVRWDAEGFLFDPGEGTQRQMAYADLAASAIHRIFVTHFHGDHCLGLAGIIQRLSLDRVDHPVHVYYPAEGQVFFERLRFASIYHPAVELVPHPIASDTRGPVAEAEGFEVFARPLDHPVPTLGYRVAERDGVRFLPARLAALGVRGPDVGALSRDGSVTVQGRAVTLAEVTEPKAGSAFAFVMDTRRCPGAVELARDVDLLVMEATYTAADQSLADAYGHASARDAAETAREAGARRLCITHFSQRYPDASEHLRDARAVFPDTDALTDLSRVAIPRRR